MADNPPIIFIHYGPSAYLRQTLRAACRSNPDKTVIFLGDQTNRRFCPPTAHFLPWRNFAHGAKIDRFRSVFRPIEGKRHKFNKQGGTERWLAFVFERWFVIEQVLRLHKFESFWTFDSDTMIAGSLSLREPRFANYPATEQCRGCCLNGLVNDCSVVESYTNYMIGLFEDEAFLNQQHERLKVHEGLCFNEMDAWQKFRDRQSLQTADLGIPRDRELFDDALAITKGFEQAGTKVLGRIPVKKVHLDDRGGAFAFPIGKSPVRLVTLNLSWLPTFLFARLQRACRPSDLLSYDPTRSTELSLRTPILWSLLARATWLRA